MRPAKLPLLLAGTLALSISGFSPVEAAPIRSIVIVHGALADGSGWRKVHDRLASKGYQVSIVQPHGRFRVKGAGHLCQPD